MESKTINEIVHVDGYQDQVDQILQQFIKVQKDKYGKYIDENSSHFGNIKILAQLLICNNREEASFPIVANIPMGQGKSSLLVEFIRFMYDYDKDFGAVIVKKTIDECKEFAIDTGISEVEEFPDYEELFLKNRTDRLKLYDEHEEFFKTMVVRGFNFNDCSRYKDKSRIWGKAPADAVEYDYRLCIGCPEKSCTVKKSKWSCENHRIVGITHTRLFLSSDVDELLESLLYFKNNNGDLLRRKLLIIDEKMEMCNVETITIKQFNKLYNLIEEEFGHHKELFSNIKQYFKKLRYPDSSSEDIIDQKEYFIDSEFTFDSELRIAFYQNTEIEREQYEQLLTVEKILNSKHITTSIKYKFGTSKEKNNLIKQISTYEYIDLAFYHQHFDKSIILDATANLDKDYRNSNILFCEGIIQSSPKINVFVPQNECNVSKSKVTGASLKLSKDEAKVFYEANITNLALECQGIIEGSNEKTLIVVYKDIHGREKYNFKDDISASLKRLKVNKDMYRLIHHGQFSTGVNHLSDCSTIIVIGQLNKSSSFYQNKSLSLGIPFIPRRRLKSYKVDPIQLNDYLIMNIQQIGRTSLRRGTIPNVYLLHKSNEIGLLVNELRDSFEFNTSTYLNKYYDTTRKKREQINYDNSSRFAGGQVMKIIKYLLSLEVGVYKRKNIQTQMGIKDNGYFSNLIKDTKEYLMKESIEHIEFKGHSVVVKATHVKSKVEMN